ncbi:HalOD1 output domain-containing protein [Natronorubrum sp. DTA28]|uniref:HalOD1 output domain-containing protein n=1 Tax=Natronorubrum sp. DTA28 TaxID=3447019 RepID=UPI003F82ABB1
MVSHAPSYRVIEAVAQKKGVSPSELSPPLFSVVDPEALDTLVQEDADSNTSQVVVEFTYLNYVVQIRNAPAVTISVQDEDAPTDNPGSVPEQKGSFED